jgi:hypothetical protein
MSALSANEKRKESCRQVGGAKKRGGHAREAAFNLQFGQPTAITYKAEADCVMSPENEATAALIPSLQATLGIHATEPNALNVSLKSGKNLQFVLGAIPEIVGATTPEEKLVAVQGRAIWEKYLKKAASEKPAGLLVYKTHTDWLFFKMDAVIDFIVANTTWRALATGRLKGDLFGQQYLTYEYRETHKSHFLGANGNKGQPLIELLAAKIPCVKVAAAAETI